MFGWNRMCFLGASFSLSKKRKKSTLNSARSGPPQVPHHLRTFTPSARTPKQAAPNRPTATMAGLMRMPNGQMIVRPLPPFALTCVQTRTRWHFISTHTLAPRSLSCPLCRCFQRSESRQPPLAASPRPTATPNRAAARGHRHVAGQGAADLQHQRVHGRGRLRPHHPGASTSTPPIPFYAARRPFSPPCICVPLRERGQKASGPRRKSRPGAGRGAQAKAATGRRRERPGARPTHPEGARLVVPTSAGPERHTPRDLYHMYFSITQEPFTRTLRQTPKP